MKHPSLAVLCVTAAVLATGPAVAAPISASMYLRADVVLGGTNVTVNSSGVQLSKLLYKPCGETRLSTGTTPTTWRFTGQREDCRKCILDSDLIIEDYVHATRLSVVSNHRIHRKHGDHTNLVTLQGFPYHHDMGSGSHFRRSNLVGTRGIRWRAGGCGELSACRNIHGGNGLAPQSSPGLRVVRLVVFTTMSTSTASATDPTREHP